MKLLNDFLEFELFKIGEYNLKVGTLVLTLLIIFITRIILWVIKKSIFRKRNLDQFVEGNYYSLYQLIKLAGSLPG